jgi:hypothetical protein
LLAFRRDAIFVRSDKDFHCSESLAFLNERACHNQHLLFR